MTRFQVKSFLRYWLHAVDHHSLHSPFLFDFYTKVIQSIAHQSPIEQIELLRQQYLKDSNTISLQGFGAGSKHFSTTNRTIHSIAKTSLTPRRFSQVYCAIARYFDAKIMLELGTSLGINTAYLAQANDTQISTFEGEPAIAQMARSTFEQLRLHHVQLIEGDIETTLPNYIHNVQKIDMAFLDANHQLEPTLRYFDWIAKKIHPKSVVILDDIHQSEGMENAWIKIRSNPLVYGSVDLYRCGIVFFDPSLNNQHVVLQF